MTERIVKIFMGIGVAGALLCIGFAVFGHHETALKGQAVSRADQHHEAAVVAATEGAQHDQVAAAQEPVLAGDAAEVQRLRTQLARLRQAPPAPVPAPPPSGPAPEPQPVVPPVDLAPVVAEQDALIAAQDRQIQDQQTQIHTLTLARDSWRLSAQSSAQEALQLRSALAAQEGLTKAALWRGRIEGFAVGVALGYGGGRIQR